MMPFEMAEPTDEEIEEQLRHQYLFAIIHAANQVSELALTLTVKATDVALKTTLGDIDEQARKLRETAEAAWLEHGGAV